MVQGRDSQVNVENLKKFQKETLSLRDDLMTKRAELQNEYNKQTPDTARIADLRKQMIDIQANIQKAAVKNGLPAWGQGNGRGRMGRGMIRFRAMWFPLARAWPSGKSSC